MPLNCTLIVPHLKVRNSGLLCFRRLLCESSVLIHDVWLELKVALPSEIKNKSRFHNYVVERHAGLAVCDIFDRTGKCSK